VSRPIEPRGFTADQEDARPAKVDRASELATPAMRSIAAPAARTEVRPGWANFRRPASRHRSAPNNTGSEFRRSASHRPALGQTRTAAFQLRTSDG